MSQQAAGRHLHREMLKDEGAYPPDWALLAAPPTAPAHSAPPPWAEQQQQQQEEEGQRDRDVADGAGRGCSGGAAPVEGARHAIDRTARGPGARPNLARMWTQQEPPAGLRRLRRGAARVQPAQRAGTQRAPPSKPGSAAAQASGAGGILPECGRSKSLRRASGGRLAAWRCAPACGL